MLTRAFGLLVLGTVSTANTYLALETPHSALGNLTATVALNVLSVNRLAVPATSSDPNCPDGFLCGDPIPCEMQGCEWCLSIDGFEFCAPSTPDKVKWCSVSPELIYGCSLVDGGNEVSCCHGACIFASSECCSWPDVKCPSFSDPGYVYGCGICRAGSTCGSNSCIAPSSSSTSTSTTRATTFTSSVAVTTSTGTTTGTGSSSVSIPTPSPSVVQIVGSFHNIGCYLDLGDSRLLNGDSFTDSGEPGLTVEACVEFAKANGWKYAGVEFGSECHVGNTLNSPDQFADSDCAQICAGKATEYCGSGGRIQVYQDTSSTTTTPMPSPTSTLAPGPAANFDVAEDVKCSDTQQASILAEMQNAMDMAAWARDHLQETNYMDYYSFFFPDSLRSRAEFAANVKQRFDRAVKLLSNAIENAKLTVKCNPNAKLCQRLPKDTYVAGITPGTQDMTVCPPFFQENTLEPGKFAIFGTSYLLTQCGNDNFNLRAAQRSRAATILHETFHTYFVSVGEIVGNPDAGHWLCEDYAYGFNGCYFLKNGVFDRSCWGYGNRPRALCPTNPSAPIKQQTDGICAAEVAEKNPDSYVHIAAGLWFSSRCEKAIPYPQLPPFPIISTDPDTDTAAAIQDRGLSQLDKRDDIPDGCPAPDNDEIPPPYDDENSTITGHVHFGDSFAAGMGAGSTSTDSCRVGSNNYGELVRQWLSELGNLSYESHVCSGDTIDGLEKQIEQWSNAGDASFATLTIGGNDLGFSNLVYYCVITPNPFWSGASNRASCEQAENNARSLMQSGALQSKLTAAYLQILNKATQANFKLYVAGYTPFFNDQTTDCDVSSFHAWWGGYKAASDWPTYRTVFLTTDLRSELNELVSDLNNVIEAAVADANQQHGSQAVYFADVTTAFNGHRWCEDGVHEPDPTNAWFFLGAWPDLQYDSFADDQAELAALASQGSVQLPDSSTCSSDPADPYVWAMCRVAEAVADDPAGLEATRLANANAALAAGDVSSQDVSVYLPTRQIKTFHPRTPGMYAYRDAILDAMVTAGQYFG